MDRNQVGMDAEARAEHFLKLSKLKLLTRNYRSRFGEIDLIMLDRDILVFIEVRKRSNPHYGGAAASVTYHKQQKLIKTAQCYLNEHAQLAQKNCRFDVIAFEDDTAHDKPLWYKDAFGVTDYR